MRGSGALGGELWSDTDLCHRGYTDREHGQRCCPAASGRIVSINWQSAAAVTLRLVDHHHGNSAAPDVTDGQGARPIRDGDGRICCGIVPRRSIRFWVPSILASRPCSGRPVRVRRRWLWYGMEGLAQAGAGRRRARVPGGAPTKFCLRGAGGVRGGGLAGADPAGDGDRAGRACTGLAVKSLARRRHGRGMGHGRPSWPWCAIRRRRRWRWWWRSGRASRPGCPGGGGGAGAGAAVAAGAGQLRHVIGAAAGAVRGPAAGL